MPGEIRQLGDAFNSMADRLVELQEDIRKQERQVMFGRIAAGLVHDLSHPIMNIGNGCKLIVKMWDDAEYREIVDNVRFVTTYTMRMGDTLASVSVATLEFEAIDKCSIGESRRTYDLDCDVSIKGDLVGEIDTSHAAAPQQRADRVAAELGTYNRLSRHSKSSTID